MNNGTTFPNFSGQDERPSAGGGEQRSWSGNGANTPRNNEQRQWGGEKKAWGGGGGGNRTFQRAPETDMTLYKPYAVVSNNDTPQPILDRFIEIAKRLDALGYTARVGGNNSGVDQLVEDTVSKKEVILPWRGFNDKESKLTFTLERAKAVAKQFHPVYESMSDGVKMFLARNARLVMGDKMVNPALFVLCWTEDGVETYRERNSRSGNAGHPIAIASAAGIQVFNLGKPGAYERLNMYLEERRNEQPVL